MNVDDRATVGWDLDAPPSGRTFSPRRRPRVGGVEYAEFPLRAAAFALDLAILALAAEPVLRPVATLVNEAVLGTGMLDSIGLRHIAGILLPVLVVAWIASAVYFVFFWVVFRASPGQMALGLFTLRATDGLPLRPRQALARWAVVVVPASFGETAFAQGLLFSLPSHGDGSDLAWTVALALSVVAAVWYAVLSVTILADRRGRGLHDRASGSVVVRRAGPAS